MKKRISQKIAKEKYGIVISKLQHYNNYKFFLLDNGNVVDSDGDIRYLNEKNLCKDGACYNRGDNVNCKHNPNHNEIARKKTDKEIKMLEKDKEHDKLVGIAMDLIESVFEIRENKLINDEEYYLLEDEIIEVLKRHI